MNDNDSEYIRKRFKKPVIGKQYLANLDRIKNHLISQDYFPLTQKNCAQFGIKERGTCNYNQCPYKEQKADSTLVIYHRDKAGETERAEIYFFHDDCILELKNDDYRLNNIN
jgi:hypothetical protein